MDYADHFVEKSFVFMVDLMLPLCKYVSTTDFDYRSQRGVFLICLLSWAERVPWLWIETTRTIRSCVFAIVCCSDLCSAC